jgi:autotransporter translocation and assembly factor TamB
VSKRLAIGLLAATIVVGFAVVNRHALLAAALQGGAGLATGASVRIEEFHVASDGAVFYGVHVSRDGRPFVDAKRVAIRFSVRDLFLGSTHRFGLRSVDVQGATVTLIRFRNGRFNVSLPGGAAAIPQRPHINPVPLRFHVRIRDAALDLQEPYAYDESGKEIRVRAINVDGDIDTASLTQYRVAGVFAQRSNEPFTIAGRIDSARGYAAHRFRASHFPLRALANYFADTPEVRILAANARHFDALLYALDVQPNVAPNYHVSLGVDVSDGRLALRALAAPVENFHAHLQVIDNAFFVRKARAALAGIPLRIDGGAYDFTAALTGRAELQLGIDGAGDLSALRQSFTFARDQEISGLARFSVLVHGSISDPVIVARVDAPHAFYRAMPFDSLDAGVVYNSNVVALAPLDANYGGVVLGVRGTLQIAPHVGSLFTIHVSGPANRLPYLNEMLGNEPLLIDASATGRDLLFHVVGSGASARGVNRMAALLQMDPQGTVAVEPFWFHTERGEFDGAYHLDRPDDTSAFWMLATNVRMHPSRYAAFPGLTLPAMPSIEGRDVQMALAGGGSGRHIVLGGAASSGDTSIAGVHFANVDAAFGGTLQRAAMNRIRASGPWGTFNGSGEFSSQRFAAYGAYRGTFEGLQPFLGSAITGHGGLAGTVGVAIEPERIIVQGDDLSMQHATLHGIPLSNASLTMAVEGNRLRLYSARAHAAGGDVVATGTFSLSAAGAQQSSSNALLLVANGLRAPQLRGIGFPLNAGTLAATGTLGAGAPLPTFDGGITINAGRIANYAIAGDGDVRVAGDSVALHRIVGAVGGSYANVDGAIEGVTSGVPAFALNANVAAAQIAPALRSFGIPNYMTDGSFNARLRIGGATTRPSISGEVGVPAGEINGLPFVDGRAVLAADPSGVTIRNGRVLVGSTHARFDATARPGNQAIALSAARARLADFNNFFDTGDTLAGEGRVQISAASRNTEVTSNGNIDVRALRYRNLPIGDTRAVWSSSHNVIRGALAVGGHEGMLRSHGSIALSPSGNLQTTLQRSRFDLAANVNQLDLSLWMPALGMQSVPITGRASGEATLHGRFPLLDVRGRAQINNGTLGPLTLDRAAIAVHAAHRAMVIDSAEMITPELSATAAGRVGLSKDAPIDVQVHAATDRLAKLAYEVSRVKLPVTGSFESTLKIGGTYRSPSFLAGFDATNVRASGIAIASLFGEVRLQRGSLVLSNAGATFDKGEMTLAGSLPLSLSPLRLASADEPLSFDLEILGLDPALFNETLGNATKLEGLVDGHIGLSGTIRRPSVVGRIALARGSYVSALERIPITRIAAALSFNRTSAAVDQASANFGNGMGRVTGRMQFPNGFSGGNSSFSFNGLAAGAQLDLPQYGSGTLDAKLTLSKQPQSDALLSGKVALSNATLPFATFLRAAAGSASIGAPPIAVAFDLTATAGKNVRVRGSGYGAGLDLGATGSVQLAGTLASPTLSGTFESTGGTLTYFDRAFRIQEGGVTFNAADGVLPRLHAVASSSVVNPDPDRARNPYGSANITIRVDGPIQGLKIGLASNPSGYSRDEILGLIAPFGGFVNGIAFSRQSMLARQQPNEITPLGALSPIPNVSVQQRSSITVGQEAFNILNAQFTAGLLAPLESTLGQGLGLSSVNLTLGYYGNVGFTATRLLGKAVSAVYAITFGVPQIQSFGLMVQANPVTTATLNFFYQSGPTKLLQLPSSPVGYNAAYSVAEPLIGNSGFSLSVQRYFW